MPEEPGSPNSPNAGVDGKGRRLTVADPFSAGGGGPLATGADASPEWVELQVGAQGSLRGSHGVVQLRGETQFSVKKPQCYGEPLTDHNETGVAFSCRKGLKRESPNQDDYSVLLRHDRSVFGVFDGHGPDGHHVSNICTRHLMPRLQVTKCGELDDEGGHAKQALVEHFKEMQLHIHEKVKQSKGSLNANTSGTTGSVVVYEQDRFWCAWVGDSRVGAGYGPAWDCMTSKDVSSDHKPELPAEKERIMAHGGQVRKFPYDIPHRVCSKNSNFPGLAMSRSFGDFVAGSLGVSHEPDVTCFPTENCQLILLCSDGVWEFISTEEAIEFMRARPLKDMQASAEALAKLAWDKWIESEGDVVDDITVIAIHPPQLRRCVKVEESDDECSP